MTQEVLKLALEALAVRFSEGWHEGIKIDASDIMLLNEAAQALAQPEQEPMAWGVDWGRAGDIPCVSIIKRLPNGGIEVVAVEYAPYTFKEKNSA